LDTARREDGSWKKDIIGAWERHHDEDRIRESCSAVRVGGSVCMNTGIRVTEQGKKCMVRVTQNVNVILCNYAHSLTLKARLCALGKNKKLDFIIGFVCSRIRQTAVSAPE
jgi:hypothetical protein